MLDHIMTAGRIAIGIPIFLILGILGLAVTLTGKLISPIAPERGKNHCERGRGMYGRGKSWVTP